MEMFHESPKSLCPQRSQKMISKYEKCVSNFKKKKGWKE